MRLIAFAAAALLFAAPASASQTVSCNATDGSDAIVEMNLSSGLPGDVPNWVRVSAGGNAWSTLEGDTGALPFVIHQAFDDGRSFSVDLTDTGVNGIIASLRLIVGEEDGAIVRAGYLRIPGTSIHTIVCDFGDSE